MFHDSQLHQTQQNTYFQDSWLHPNVVWSQFWCQLCCVPSIGSHFCNLQWGQNGDIKSGYDRIFSFDISLFNIHINFVNNIQVGLPIANDVGLKKDTIFHSASISIIVWSLILKVRLWDVRGDQELCQYKPPSPNSRWLHTLALPHYWVWQHLGSLHLISLQLHKRWSVPVWQNPSCIQWRLIHPHVSTYFTRCNLNLCNIYPSMINS